MSAKEQFIHRKIIFDKLIPYGFVKRGNTYEYNTWILDGEFQMYVIISEAGDIETKVIDSSVDEEFVLHQVQEASGSFVGRVRAEYEAVLASIREKCTETAVYKSEITRKIISYVREKYGDELEFLWKVSPANSIWRRKDSEKWYAAVLVVSKAKLGLESEEKVEIIDLRVKPEDIGALIDGVKYFPGYHMNKKSWYTICLDGSVSVQEICERIDASYELAKK